MFYFNLKQIYSRKNVVIKLKMTTQSNYNLFEKHDMKLSDIIRMEYESSEINTNYSITIETLHQSEEFERDSFIIIITLISITLIVMLVICLKKSKTPHKNVIQY